MQVRITVYFASTHRLKLIYLLHVEKYLKKTVLKKNLKIMAPI